MRQRRRRDERRVLDAHAVMHFVALLQPAQNRDGRLHGRLVDHHRLEAPLQRRVFLDVLAIFVERRRADASAIRRARAAASACSPRPTAPSAAPAPTIVCSSSMNRMISPSRVGDLLEERLEPVFKFAAILRAGDHRAQIHRDEPLVLQRFRHVAADDAPRQAFGDGRLAHARFADEHRIVLRAPREWWRLSIGVHGLVV